MPRSEPIIVPPHRRRRATRSAYGAIARWQRASAAASAASGGSGTRGEPEPGLDHLLHLLLPCAAPSGDGVLDLIRRVLGDVAPGRGRLGEREPARLADAHRGAHVDLEEHVLDRDRLRAELGDQPGELTAQLGEALRQRTRRRRAHDAERQGDHGLPVPDSSTAYPQRVRPGSMPRTIIGVADRRRDARCGQREHVYDDTGDRWAAHGYCARVPRPLLLVMPALLLAASCSDDELLPRRPRHDAALTTAAPTTTAALVDFGRPTGRDGGPRSAGPRRPRRSRTPTST